MGNVRTVTNLCVCGHLAANHVVGPPPHNRSPCNECKCGKFQRSVDPSHLTAPAYPKVVRLKDYARIPCFVCKRKGLVRGPRALIDRLGMVRQNNESFRPRGWFVLSQPGGRPALVCSDVCAKRLMMGEGPPPRRGA